MQHFYSALFRADVDIPQGESETVESPSGNGEATQPPANKEKKQGSSARKSLDQQSANEIEMRVSNLIAPTLSLH